MLKKRVFWPRSVLIRRKGVWLVCCCGSWSMYKCRFFYIQNVGTSVEQNGILDLIFLLWFNLKSHRFRLLYCRIRCGTWTTSIILMFQQQWHTRKCSRTCLTIIFLHHRMCLKVSAKIWSIGKCTITILTCKRFLSRMGSNVTYLLKKEIKKINFLVQEDQEENVKNLPCNNHGRENALPHNLHLHGNVWVRMCIFNAPNET